MKQQICEHHEISAKDGLGRNWIIYRYCYRIVGNGNLEYRQFSTLNKCGKKTSAE